MSLNIGRDDAFLKHFPDWEMCLNCENIYKKNTFKECPDCQKRMCSRCFKFHLHVEKREEKH